MKRMNWSIASIVLAIAVAGCDKSVTGVGGAGAGAVGGGGDTGEAGQGGAGSSGGGGAGAGGAGGAGAGGAGTGGTGGTGAAGGTGGAGGMMAAERRLLVATTDYMTPGQLAEVDLETRAVTSRVATGEDPVLRTFGGKVLLVNRFGATNADNVAALDATTLMGQQHSTGPGSNPQDIACVTLAQCYVAVYGIGKLPVMNLETGARVTDIDLASFDPDGVPNASAVYLAGTTAYVAIQRLDMSFVPRGPGQIVRIDTTTNAVVGTIDLGTANPNGSIQARPGTDDLCVATNGDLSGTQGGIECWSKTTNQHTGFIAEASQLGGYLSGWTFGTDGMRGWAAVNKAFPMSDLRQFIVGGAVSSPLGTSHGITDVVLDDRGQLWTVDGTMGAKGLRVFSMSGAEITTAPIGVGALPPVFQGGMILLP